MLSTVLEHDRFVSSTQKSLTPSLYVQPGRAESNAIKFGGSTAT